MTNLSFRQIITSAKMSALISEPRALQPVVEESFLGALATTQGVEFRDLGTEHHPGQNLLSRTDDVLSAVTEPMS